ncbi:MBL fold metallo-hydrolase [Babesia caballi]|uniref:MBL fold metallo-hydrolase n=1 Tax=Babesia caballi TaxID=5871 RepID=A0AAV4LW49_BABCB|nr:MBL fold metallo-hydrolase [Babesia caballi]
MAGVDLLYKPTGRSVFELRSNLANDLRQRSIAKRLDGKQKGGKRSGGAARAAVPPLRASELAPAPASDLVYSRIDESVSKTKSVLKGLKVPEVDVEDARREYIQKVGKDYSAVGLTSYILAQKDAKEFRERCFHILSWRPKAAQADGPYDTSDAPFFSNRSAGAGKPRTPDDVLLSSLGKNSFMVNYESGGYDFYSPARSRREEAASPSSPFATQAQWSDRGTSLFGDKGDSDHEYTIGPMTDEAETGVEGFSMKRGLGACGPRSDAAATSTPEKASVESQQKRLQVLEELLEEHKDIIPRDLDVKTLGYAEKRKLLRQLGFGDDYIANRLCDRYRLSQKRRNTKLTPLEAFSMYDRQDMNESMQVHKDLSVEFSRQRGLRDEGRVQKSQGETGVVIGVDPVVRPIESESTVPRRRARHGGARRRSRQLQGRRVARDVVTGSRGDA